MAPTKVLVVDDSALMRQLLTEIVGRDPTLRVVSSASNPYDAWDRIKSLQPDVLTLDVEMPRMDGLTFLEKLMTARPMPVVMVSSLTEKGCDTTWRALELGAVDFVTKPKIDVADGTIQLAGEICDKIKVAAKSRVRRRSAPGMAASPVPAANRALRTTDKVIAIGASTGGTEALYAIITNLPPDSAGVVAVIHMPEGFTRSYAQRLDNASQVTVTEAVDGMRILPGHVFIAPGGFHTRIVRDGANYVVRVVSGEPVSRHKPSVDVLFESCSQSLGPNVVGAILTGMGADGARGMLAMHEAGAHTIAQDEATCVVFGMPREAIAMGGVDEILPLDRIAARVVHLAR